MKINIEDEIKTINADLEAAGAWNKYNGLRDTKDGQAYIWSIDDPWNDEHKTEGRVFLYPDGHKTVGCKHQHCKVRAYYEFLEKISADPARIVREKALNKNKPGTKEQTKESKQKEPPKLKSITAKALQEADLPPIRYPVRDMIPEGLTVIASPPKSGKSWLMLQLCLAICEGQKILDFETTKSAALYLALEDGDKFEQERLNLIRPHKDAPDNFYIVFEDVVKLENGFLQQLDGIAEEVPDLGIVIIDTLNFVSYEQKRGQSAYSCDYQTGKDLKKWADAHQIAVVVVTHTTKAQHPEDLFSNITGTVGITGAADCNIVLAKEKRDSKNTTLAITGRRVKSSQHNLLFNDGIWTRTGEAIQETEAEKEKRVLLDEYRNSDIRAALVKICEQNIDGFKGKATDLIEKARDLEIYITETPKTVGGFLNKMQNFFTVEDGLKLTISKHGTAPRTYDARVWNRT